MRVLEPSAGTGALASECLTRGATVVLVEVNAHAAKMLETFRPKVDRQATGGKVERVHHADFLTLGLSELGTFDAIFCRNVLFYFEPDRRRDILERLSRQMVADGRLFLGASETVLGLSDRFEGLSGVGGLRRTADPAPVRSA